MQAKIHLKMSSNVRDDEHAIIDIALDGDQLDSDLEVTAVRGEDVFEKTYEVELPNGAHELVIEYKNDEADFDENNELINDRNFILEAVEVEIDSQIHEIGFENMTGGSLEYDSGEVVYIKKWVDGEIVIGFETPFESEEEPEEEPEEESGDED